MSLIASPCLAPVADLLGDEGEAVGGRQRDEAVGPQRGPNIAASFSLAASPSLAALGIVPGSAAPAFADLDGDGDLDALLGEADGRVRFVRNRGSALAPDFEAAGTSEARPRAFLARAFPFLPRAPFTEGRFQKLGVFHYEFFSQKRRVLLNAITKQHDPEALHLHNQSQCAYGSIGGL